MAYSDLKAPKNDDMNEDFEAEIMDFEDDEMNEEMPQSDLQELLKDYSREEIEAYLEQMNDDNTEEDEFAEPEMVAGDY
jgi:hypothetical protein